MLSNSYIDKSRLTSVALKSYILATYQLWYHIQVQLYTIYS